MSKKEIYSQIQYDDLNTDMKTLADYFGIDLPRQLVENFAGMSFHVPTVARMRPLVERYVQKNLGKKFKTIASELEVSEQLVRNTYKSNKKAIKQ